jgi:hypothetical protein
MGFHDVFLPEDIPVPSDFEEIDSVVARSEAHPERRSYLEVARKRLASREPDRITGLAAFRLRKGWSWKRLSEELGSFAK